MTTLPRQGLSNKKRDDKGQKLSKIALDIHHVGRIHEVDIIVEP